MTRTSRRRSFVGAATAVLALTASALVAAAADPATADPVPSATRTATSSAARVAMPVVSSVRPGPGRSTGGQRVTLRGANFRDILGVSFGTGHGTSIHRVSDHTLTVVTPAHSQGIVNVRVRTRYGRSDPRLVARYCFLGAPAILTDDLSDALTGQAYLTTLRIYDTRKGVWSVTSGALPTGLAVRGATISGTPSIAGTAEHVTVTPTLTFTDRSGQRASKPLSLTIARNHWAGSTLTLPSTVAGSSTVLLNGVACPATGACAVTGLYVDDQPSYQRLLATQSGASWSTVAPALPTGVVAWLAQTGGISCAAAGSCVAVVGGRTSTGADVPVVTSLQNGVWQSDVAPTNPGATSSTVTAVECWAVRRCIAVGQDSDGHGLIDVLGASGWQLAADPDGDIAGAHSLSGVSCDSSGRCTAVGANAGGPVALSTAVAGGPWTGTELPLPADAGGRAAIGQIDCPTQRACVAVGSYPSTAGGRAPVVETLAGTTWTARPSPVPTDSDGTGSGLTRVSCPAAGQCVALGSYTRRSQFAGGFLVRLTGTSLTAVDPLAPYADPSELACPTAAFCALGGTQYDPSNLSDFALTGQLDGFDAATQLAADAPDSGNHYDVDAGGIFSVACSAAHACVAVGYHSTTSGALAALIETYQP